MHPMTPAEYAAAAKDWITAAVIVLGFLITNGLGLVALWKSKVAEMEAKNVKDMASKRLDTHGQQIDTLMLHTNPPGTSTNIGAVNVEPKPADGAENNTDESAMKGTE